MLSEKCTLYSGCTNTTYPVWNAWLHDNYIECSVCSH